MTVSIDANSAICMVIGDPIQHSLSPRMHNAGYRALELPYVMVAARVASSELREAIRGGRALNIRGLAVTMPHKVAAISSLDVIDPVARTIGAVNTVVNSNGALCGYNTDWLGIQRPLEKHGALEGRTVAILGAGGAAQAALYACSLQGASITVFNRTLEKAHALATPFEARAAILSEETDISGYEIIINTTPVGMGDNSSRAPINVEQLSKQHIVFETIYSPRHTPLVNAARKCGSTVILGIEMFVEQGAAQFELHTGMAAPKDAMLAALNSSAFQKD